MGRRRRVVLGRIRLGVGGGGRGSRLLDGWVGEGRRVRGSGRRTCCGYRWLLIMGSDDGYWGVVTGFIDAKGRLLDVLRGGGVGCVGASINVCVDGV